MTTIASGNLQLTMTITRTAMTIRVKVSTPTILETLTTSAPAITISEKVAALVEEAATVPVEAHLTITIRNL
jgi:hypothetical protein